MAKLNRNAFDLILDDVRVGGIPCSVAVDDEDGYPYRPNLQVSAVIDRKGYRADWLEARMSEDERLDLLQVARECWGEPAGL